MIQLHIKSSHKETAAVLYETKKEYNIKHKNGNHNLAAEKRMLKNVKALKEEIAKQYPEGKIVARFFDTETKHGKDAK